ncbi:DNA-binding response regulator [Dyella solisilvae]|uniref:DNA-binding response regulator n=1 Tax=Dyella solisilvae TaxID=1920168 RepID=A0A370KB57_9GAMM|nr:response regulator transcription factor [Dyella solisilvae]RDI99697.1 DNA-binding response regulator [Dyella solisilvae]
MTIRVILADDHPIVRSGVRSLLESSIRADVVADVGSPAELLAAIERHSCDLVVSDFSMPGGQLADGLHMLGMIRRRWPDLPVIVLTMVSNAGVLSSILAAGVRGLLSKSDALNELTLAIQAVSHNRPYLSAEIRKAMEVSGATVPGGAPPALSKREAEVLRLFASGFTVSEIAGQLNRSVKTISRQKMDAMSKLGLKSDLEVYSYAREHGILA